MQYEVQGLLNVEGKLVTVSSWKGNSLFNAVVEIYHLIKLSCDKVKVAIVF